MTHLDDNGSLLLDDFTSGYKNSMSRQSLTFGFAFEDHFDHNHFELTSNINPIKGSSLTEDVDLQPAFCYHHVSMLNKRFSPSETSLQRLCERN